MGLDVSRSLFLANPNQSNLLPDSRNYPNFCLVCFNTQLKIVPPNMCAIALVWVILSELRRQHEFSSIGVVPSVSHREEVRERRVNASGLFLGIRRQEKYRKLPYLSLKGTLAWSVICFSAGVVILANQKPSKFGGCWQQSLQARPSWNVAATFKVHS